MDSANERLLYVHDLGLVDYDEAWAFQRAAAAARIEGKRLQRDGYAPAVTSMRQGESGTGSGKQAQVPDVLDQDLLILCEHPPVITLGRSTKPGNLLATPDYLDTVGVQLREVERGGDVTVHEPGQLVAYPIVDLERHRKDLHWYLRQIEEAVIVALSEFGLRGERNPGLTGVWIEGRKIASIGVHARDWVTWHGVALNVVNDLSTFGHVVPCGIPEVEMTSVARELVPVAPGNDLMSQVKAAIAQAMSTTLELRLNKADWL